MQDLLFLAHRIPFPPDKGDKIRSYNILKFLAPRYRVHLGCFVDDDRDLRFEGELKDLCGELRIIPLTRAGAAKRWLVAGATGAPLSVARYRDSGMRDWVNRVLAERRPRRIFVFSAAMAQYVMDAGVGEANTILDLVDVDSDKWRQYGEVAKWPASLVYKREWRTLARFEAKAMRSFDANLVVSKVEQTLARALATKGGAKIRVLRNGVDTGYFDPAVGHDRPYGEPGPILVFTGAMDYRPNVEGVRWFANEVFPLVRGRAAGARFYIVGSNPTGDVKNLGRLPGVTVTGRVPDIRPYIAHADVVVAPLLVARGIQNKVLEAMAMAKPIVATPKAVEGLDLVAGHDVVVENDARGFSEAVAALLVDGRDKALGSQARSRVVRDYQWTAALGELENLLEAEPLAYKKFGRSPKLKEHVV